MEVWFPSFFDQYLLYQLNLKFTELGQCLAPVKLSVCWCLIAYLRDHPFLIIDHGCCKERVHLRLIGNFKGFDFSYILIIIKVSQFFDFD